MARRPDSHPPRRRGRTALLLLAASAIVGTGLAGLARVLGPRTEVDAGGGRTVVYEEPSGTVSVRLSDAARVDTFPQVLSVSDAVEVEEGWVALDAQSGRIHVVPDEPDTPLRSFARQGEGPGELRDPSGLAVSGGVISVVETRGGRLVRYRMDGTALAPVPLGQSGCAFGPAHALFPDSRGGLFALRGCSGTDGVMRGMLLGVDPDGAVSIVEDRQIQSLLSGAAHPFAVPVATVLNGTPYMGTIAEGCLRRPDGTGSEGAPDALCAPPGAGVPLPDSMRAAFELMKERLEQIGGSFEVPEEWPAFSGVRTSAAGPVLVVPVAAGQASLDLLAADGSRTRFVAEAPGGTFIGQRHFLLVRELLEGTELAWVTRHD